MRTGARVWEHFTAVWYVLHCCTIPTPLCLSTPLCLFCTAAPYIKRKSPPELLFRWASHLVFHTLLIIYTSLSSSSPPIKTAKTSKPDGKIIKWNRSFGCFFYAFMAENWMTEMPENWEITDILSHSTSLLRCLLLTTKRCVIIRAATVQGHIYPCTILF